MSTNPAEAADQIPGAFPSEDITIENEQLTQSSHEPCSVGGAKATGDEELAAKARAFAQQQHAAHTAGGQTDKASELSSQNDKAREFHAQQNAAHTAGGQKTDKYIPASQKGAGATPSQHSESWTDASNPDDLLRNKNSSDTPTNVSSLGTTSSTGQQTSSSPEAGIDLSSIGADLAETATAFGLAAKDAFFAAKEAAAPAANAVTEQAQNLAGYAQENAVPAFNHAAEQTQNAAAYTRDAAVSIVSGTSQKDGSSETVATGGILDTANSAANYAKDTAYSVANTAQTYAPHVLGEPDGTGASARDIASEVPLTVQESVNRAGESPEAATNAQAVEGKSRMERELLSQSHGHSQASTEASKNVTSRAKGLSLEEQLMPDSLTPGVAKVLGTEHDRSFPLGATDDKSSWLSNTQPDPKSSKSAAQEPTQVLKSLQASRNAS